MSRESEEEREREREERERERVERAEARVKEKARALARARAAAEAKVQAKMELKHQQGRGGGSPGGVGGVGVEVEVEPEVEPEVEVEVEVEGKTMAETRKKGKKGRRGRKGTVRRRRGGKGGGRGGRRQSGRSQSGRSQGGRQRGGRQRGRQSGGKTSRQPRDPLAEAGYRIISPPSHSPAWSNALPPSRASPTPETIPPPAAPLLLDRSAGWKGETRSPYPPSHHHHQRHQRHQRHDQLSSRPRYGYDDDDNEWWETEEYSEYDASLPPLSSPPASVRCGVCQEIEGSPHKGELGDDPVAHMRVVVRSLLVRVREAEEVGRKAVEEAGEARHEADVLRSELDDLARRSRARESVLRKRAEESPAGVADVLEEKVRVLEEALEEKVEEARVMSEAMAWHGETMVSQLEEMEEKNAQLQAAFATAVAANQKLAEKLTRVRAERDSLSRIAKSVASLSTPVKTQQSRIEGLLAELHDLERTPSPSLDSSLHYTPPRRGADDDARRGDDHLSPPSPIRSSTHSPARPEASPSAFMNTNTSPAFPLSDDDSDQANSDDDASSSDDDNPCPLFDF